MSKGIFYALIVLIVLGVTLALPLRRGVQMNCDGGIYERMVEVGLPFGFYKTTGQSSMTCIRKDKSQVWDPTYSVRLTNSFKPAPLVLDLLIAGTILIASYRLINPRRT